jgi:hypothetical protein
MKGFLQLVAVTAVVALAATASAVAESWTDPAGDAQGGAPDITAVDVSNDAAGTIKMVVTAPLAQGSLALVFMDTNLNGKFDDGTDAMMGAWGLSPDLAISVEFSGADVVSVRPTLEVTPTTVAFSFSKSDAGIDTGFGFWVASQSASQFGTDQLGDEMPDGTGTLTYMLTAAPTPQPTPAPAPAVVKPVIGTPVVTPRKIVAGKRTTITFPVTRSDNGQPLRVGTMVCDPSVAGKVLRHAESFKAGKARLSFLVPKTAKGKQLKVKVTIKAATKSATKVVTFRVK